MMDYQQVAVHIQHLQGVAARMHESSRSAKNFTLAIVGAILTFGASTEKPYIVLVGLIPAILFALLDGYYLGIERDVVHAQNRFLDLSPEKQNDEFLRLDLDSSFAARLKSLGSSMKSFSIWPYYAGMLISIGIVFWLTPDVP